MAPRLEEEADDAAKDVPQEAADDAVADAAADKVSEEAEASGTPAGDDTDEPAGAAGTVALTKDASDTASDTASNADKDAAKDEKKDDEKDGPVFDISDRRASMTADRTGVRFQLDETEAEFGWDEIGAVEVETPRFGRRFTVTLHTTGRRHYQSDVDAPSRSSLKAWTAELDAVLDAYFEET
ncbi:hypothetical protein [Streptomyces sp. NPDC006645]|uniref:hypothetical protein n=1 Tax=unclassified Streptomyces TaxID=2593676 RepID=UPI0033AA53B5